MVALNCAGPLGSAAAGSMSTRWKARGFRRLGDKVLAKELEPIFRQSRRTYGARRLQQALRQQGIRCGRKRLVPLMSQLGLQPVQKRRSRPRTTQSLHHEPIAPNRLNQLPLPPSAPNQVWCADLTYLPSQEDGWLYLAAELDLCSKRLVGWKLSSSLAPPVQELSNAPLNSGLSARSSITLIAEFNMPQVLSVNSCSQQVTPSMSRKACCYDNAAMESFWATLETECFQGQIPINLKHAQTILFDYIETFYNPTRLHSSLGYLSPIEFENRLAFLKLNN